MSQHAMSITLNRREIPAGNVYITVGFIGGFTTKYFGVNGEIYAGNYAFSPVLWNYWRETCKRITMSLTLKPTYSLVSLVTKDKQCAEEFTDLVGRLLNPDYDREIFERARQMTIDDYKNAYRDVNLRATYKLYEITDMNKGFDLIQLSKDMQSLTFEAFSEQAGRLLVPGNLYAYIDGVTEKVDENDIVSIREKIPHQDTSVAPAVKTVDPILKKDLHHIAPGNRTVAYSALVFDFLEPEINAVDRYVLLQLWKEQMSAAGKKAAIRFDDADMALIFENETLNNMKPLIREHVTAEEFKVYKNRIEARYQTLLNDYPEYFGIEAVTMEMSRIAMHEFLNVVVSMTYENYLELIRTVEYKLTAADSVISKEAVNV